MRFAFYMIGGDHPAAEALRAALTARGARVVGFRNGSALEPGDREANVDVAIAEEACVGAVGALYAPVGNPEEPGYFPGRPVLGFCDGDSIDALADAAVEASGYVAPPAEIPLADLGDGVLQGAGPIVANCGAEGAEGEGDAGPEAHGESEAPPAAPEAQEPAGDGDAPEVGPAPAQAPRRGGKRG